MKTAARSERRLEKLVPQIAALADPAAREAFLRHHRTLQKPETAEWLAAAARDRLRTSPTDSLGLAEMALVIAAATSDRRARAHALRAKANSLWFLNQLRDAVPLFDEAAAVFRDLADDKELGRTLSSSLQSLILLGEYDRATRSVEEASGIFRRLGDDWRLARLQLNAGNIFHRQDRFAEAQEVYEQAWRALVQYGDAEGTGVALHNMSVCLISLNDFRGALARYEAAREFCREHGMPQLVGQAEYNIAYLYYLRGEYSRAVEMLRATRIACRQAGDAYHHALCNLDESEIYLELNLSREAEELAQEATGQFEALGMGYEAAKALSYAAIALGQQEKSFQALDRFARAREMFVREKNRVWPWLIDLYQALLLYQEGRLFEARRLCAGALEFFGGAGLPGKEAICRLLMARLLLSSSDYPRARRECARALETADQIESPVVQYQARFLMGRLEEAGGNLEEARKLFEAARSTLETLRSFLRGEELKIGFMKNKLEVYESLVSLCLRAADQPAEGEGHSAGMLPASAKEQAFQYMEQARSRALWELMFERSRQAPRALPGQSDLVRQVRELREELNWYYHRVEIEQLRQPESSTGWLKELHDELRARERQFLRFLREIPAGEAEQAGLQSGPVLDVEAIRGALGPDACLLEYFRVGDTILAAVINATSLEIVPVTLTSRVNNLVRLLQFQLSKFRLGADYVTAFEQALLQATQSHLRELYEEILAPVRPLLTGRHLVVVPHDALHYVPFQALFDGRRYIVDTYTVSYAPSASVYALCHEKSANTEGGSLILGISDSQAPEILGEVQSVAAVLPQPQLYLGAAATEAVLREKGPGCRFLHIATHGYFREDNPMFSAIRLGDSYLTLHDLYQLELPADLVTLSGCSTGLSRVAAGDELLGLARGLLFAGARSVLLTLWDVHDQSSAEFMRLFYSRLRDYRDRALALQSAMQELKKRRPHPYYWAPFVLIGKALPS